MTEYSNAISKAIEAVQFLELLPVRERVAAINAIRSAIHQLSPFKTEPVDFVEWIERETVEANDYNPNSVAPPEMELLRLSIMADGYTQPIVPNSEEGRRMVIAGFHRNRVGKECSDVTTRVHGFLPVVQIRTERVDREDRMASTVRHNRARGKHSIDGMSQIVVDLKRRNWSDEKIGRELGMDPDEVLRLTQISGLREMFSDVDFSQAWEVGDDEDISIDDVEDAEALT